MSVELRLPSLTDRNRAEGVDDVRTEVIFVFVRAIRIRRLALQWHLDAQHVFRQQGVNVTCELGM